MTLLINWLFIAGTDEKIRLTILHGVYLNWLLFDVFILPIILRILYYLKPAVFVVANNEHASKNLRSETVVYFKHFYR